MLSLSVGMLSYFLIFFFSYNNFAWDLASVLFCCLFLCEFSFPELLEGNFVQRALLTAQSNLLCCFGIVFKNMLVRFLNIPVLCWIYFSPPSSLSLLWSSTPKGVLMGLFWSFMRYTVLATLQLLVSPWCSFTTIKAKTFPLLSVFSYHLTLLLSEYLGYAFFHSWASLFSLAHTWVTHNLVAIVFYCY